jgi:hypothetical protein
MKFFRLLEFARRWNNRVFASPSLIHVSRERCLILIRRNAVNPSILALAVFLNEISAADSRRWSCA